jgi:hypothetical protein
LAGPASGSPLPARSAGSSGSCLALGQPVRTMATRPPLMALVLRRGRPTLAPSSSSKSSLVTALASALCLPLAAANTFSRLGRMTTLAPLSSSESSSAMASASTSRPPLAAADAFLRLGWKIHEASLPCAFLWGFGVPPANSGLCTPLSTLAARGGLQRPAGPKLFKTLRVLRPPGAFFPCFFLADMATATAPVVPSSPESIRRILSKGLMTGGVVGAIFLLLELAVFTEASGEKSEVSADLFLPNLKNLAVKKSATR